MSVDGSDHSIIHPWKKILFQNIAAGTFTAASCLIKHQFTIFSSSSRMTSRAFSVAESLDIFVSLSYLFYI
jgi:hypothetical protein